MINDTVICSVAKKLHRIKPSVVIDDPLKVEELLRKWWDESLWNDLAVFEILTEDEAAEFERWYRAHLLHGKELANAGKPSGP